MGRRVIGLRPEKWPYICQVEGGGVRFGGGRVQDLGLNGLWRWSSSSSPSEKGTECPGHSRWRRSCEAVLAENGKLAHQGKNRVS